MERFIQKRCDEIAALYQPLYDAAEKVAPDTPREQSTLLQQDIDAMEERLAAAGIDVLDSSESLPVYLTTGERFRVFWSQVQQHQDARQEIVSIRPTGELGYRLLVFQKGAAMVYSMVRPMEPDGETNYQARPILDWELSRRGNFYYRIHQPGDKHFAGYEMLRLEKPDAALFGLQRTYLMAGSYFASNLFLTDWTEEDYSDLSFNDLWEYLYHDVTGSYFDPEGYEYNAAQHHFELPAEEFEPLIQRYFRIDLETLRHLAGYNPQRNTYPWRKVVTVDYVDHLSLYTMEPEVTAQRENPDGTITLTVQVISTDLKTDCAFAHQVTVRPLQDGSFQFVGNQMLPQGTAEPPTPTARLSWSSEG